MRLRWRLREAMFDGGIPPLPRRSPIVIIVLLPLPPVSCLAGTSVPVPHLQDRVCRRVGRADIHQPPHCPLLRGEGGDKDGRGGLPPPPTPRWSHSSSGMWRQWAKGGNNGGPRCERSPPPMSTAATMAAAVTAGCCACCCHHWRRQQCGGNAMVTMATMGMTIETTVCTVMVASTAATAVARAPRRKRRRCPCRRSYLCSHALSFCVSCFFDCSH